LPHPGLRVRLFFASLPDTLKGVAISFCPGSDTDLRISELPFLKLFFRQVNFAIRQFLFINPERRFSFHQLHNFGNGLVAAKAKQAMKMVVVAVYASIKTPF
jgi:hypothetical protein